jgi:hypothetical protein
MLLVGRELWMAGQGLILLAHTVHVVQEPTGKYQGSLPMPRNEHPRLVMISPR